jgi:hypothetical protein
MRVGFIGVMGALLALAASWSSPPSGVLEGTVYQSAAASGCGGGARPINPPASLPACRLKAASGAEVIAMPIRSGQAHRVRADSGGRYVLDLEPGDYLVSTGSPPYVVGYVHLTPLTVYMLDLYIFVPVAT